MTTHTTRIAAFTITTLALMIGFTPATVIAGPQRVQVAPDGNNTNPVRLGVAVAPNSNGSGLVVRDVIPGTPAAQMGLEPGDVILRINSNPINSQFALRNALIQAENNGGALNIIVINVRTNRPTSVRGQLDAPEEPIFEAASPRP